MGILTPASMRLVVKFSSVLKIAQLHPFFSKRGPWRPKRVGPAVASQEKHGDCHCDQGSVTSKWVQDSDGFTMSTKKMHDVWSL